MRNISYFLATPRAALSIASVLKEVVLNFITLESLESDTSLSSKISDSSSESGSACC